MTDSLNSVVTSMDASTFKLLGAGLMSLGMMGAAIGVGLVFSAAISAIARNPGAEGKIKAPMMLGMALAEAMGIFSFVLALMLMFS